MTKYVLIQIHVLVISVNQTQSRHLRNNTKATRRYLKSETTELRSSWMDWTSKLLSEETDVARENMSGVSS